METTENFLTFNLNGYNHTDQLVASLLKKTTTYMNQEVKKRLEDYASMKGSEVEVLAYNSMINVAPSVNFPKERIELISGHVLPDIVLRDTRYGVEVKSTQKDAWTSTGSSIVESTRDANTDHIYMLFAKLGGIPAFKCKPYQECLSNIAVTHSPRYLIDMNLDKHENIFAKMNINYDEFRRLEESTKIAKVRRYFQDKAKKEHKDEMPWWMGEATNINISFFNDLSTDEKDILRAKACILFHSLYKQQNASRYRPISLWLINYYSLLCPNMRDDFSAGGQCNIINGQKLPTPYPHIVYELLQRNELIKKLLADPDEDLKRGIEEFWDFEYDRKNLYMSWINMVENTFHTNPKLKNIEIRLYLETNAKPY